MLRRWRLLLLRRLEAISSSLGFRSLNNNGRENPWNTHTNNRRVKM
jgi:hypothetical protein